MEEKTMSEKTVGVLGQKYEDRKTKKVGTLVDRNDETKKLSFLGEDATPFEISYAAFKSNWRKYVSESEQTTSETVEAEAPKEELISVEEPESFMTDEEAVKQFTDAVIKERGADINITDDSVTVIIEGVKVFTAEKSGNYYEIAMLPDVFTLSTWNNMFTLEDLHFNVLIDKFGYILISNVDASLVDILNTIKDAVLNINLYGYRLD